MLAMKKWQHLKIPFHEIEVATNNFEICIGKGGYGWVYKGQLFMSGKVTSVAVKRFYEQFGQGLKEFLTEIDLLCGQKHPNLVSLLGFCDDQKEKIIVYEYAERGSLDNYIRPTCTSTCRLSWLERLKICVDAACGLDHLHNHVGEHQAIIHRDIKSANVLLDENWVAKISDLGLSRLSVAGSDRSLVISHACGTPGYCEPEYIISGTVTKKSDVYSFGMVLFEVFCGKLCTVKERDGFLLSAKVAKHFYENNKLEEIVDPSLQEHLNSDSMTKFSAIAYKCLHKDREQRPSMDIVKKELYKTLNIHVQMLSFNRVEDVKRITTSLEAVKLAKEAYEREISEAIKEESSQIVDALFTSHKRYRRYTIDDIKVATDSFSETKVVANGRYGKVYKCNLDHTPVAIKFFGSITAEKKRQFLREVEVLSQLIHPHVVQLCGACPERGYIIYEYMENGSLEDYISKKNSTFFLPWYTRFRIAFEVACALAFLHNSKPDPIVHRDLKPGNILLDRNFVSKIGDMGMSIFIADVVPDNVTEYNDSVVAGTLYYMDPEYHRTGTLRPKSDLYALGIILLQLLTSLQPKGIVSKVESAVSCGTLSEILDKTIYNWPLAEAKELAKLGLKCCSLRCQDRPELDTEVLPILKKLHEFGDTRRNVGKSINDVPSHFYCPILKEIMDDPHIAADGFTYEYEAIQLWLKKHNASPMTNLQLQHKMLIPNLTLRSGIKDWKLRFHI